MRAERQPRYSAMLARALRRLLGLLLALLFLAPPGPIYGIPLECHCSHKDDFIVAANETCAKLLESTKQPKENVEAPLEPAKLSCCCQSNLVIWVYLHRFKASKILALGEREPTLAQVLPVPFLQKNSGELIIFAIQKVPILA